MAGPNINPTLYYIFITTFTYLLPIVTSYLIAMPICDTKQPSQSKILRRKLHQRRHKSSSSRFRHHSKRVRHSTKVLTWFWAHIGRLFANFSTLKSTSPGGLSRLLLMATCLHSVHVTPFVAFSASGRLSRGTHLCTTWDTDSFKIGVDSQTSRTMSPCKANFRNLRTSTASISGIGTSTLQVCSFGTFVFNIKDDTGRRHTVSIPNSLYVPGLQYTLLCPQHWAQESPPGSVKMESDSKACRLQWNHGRHCKTVQYDDTTNVPTFFSATNSMKYLAYEAVFAGAHPFHQRKRVRILGHSPTVNPSKLLIDKDVHINHKKVSNISGGEHNTAITAPFRRGALAFTFQPPHSDDGTVLEADDLQAELMQWHYHLGHLSFANLHRLAKRGEIPHKLRTVTPPKCAGCLFGAMTKVPWRTMASNKHVFVITSPGKCVSVDQLQSTQVGFIAQLKGKLTMQRYNAATIFVDHFSRIKYVYLMRNLSSDETISAKQAFEQFASRHGVAIRHYHCNNGRFADNAFTSHCKQRHQTVTYCGVNAHFQNGIAEKAIRDLQESAQKQLLHAMARWPKVTHIALWPYALCFAAHLNNTVPTLDNKASRLEKFSGIPVGSNIRMPRVCAS